MACNNVDAEVPSDGGYKENNTDSVSSTICMHPITVQMKCPSA